MPDPMPQTILRAIPRLWQTVLFPGQPLAQTRIAWKSLAILALLPALLLYPWLGFHLLEPDEGRYAQIPREMLQNDQWVVPTLQGEPYLDKPPLLYWLVCLSYSAFGVSETSARLIPAICVHLTILGVYWLGRRSLGERPAFWAAILLTIAPGFLGIARLLLLDGLLTLCVTISVLCGFEAVRTGGFKRSWWILSAIASGLGFLTKGPISEILLFPPLMLFAWLQTGTARVRWRDLALFAAVVVGINIPWYIAIYLREPEFLRYFFWEHNVMRFLQPFDHLQPVWFYLPILAAGLLPGSFVMVSYLRHLLLMGGEAATIRSAAGGFWLMAGCWCVLFFSLSGSKLPTYILPAFPFLCLSLGEYLVRSQWERSRWVRGIAAGFASLLLIVNAVGLPWYARERSPYGQPDIVHEYVDDETPVVTYPRNCDSLAFYLNRSDFNRVRSKEVNQLMVDMHHRPKTVILFSHRHSFEAFRQALPESLEVTENVTMKRPAHGILGKLVGDSPWGLTDIAVIRPAAVVRAQSSSK